MQKETPPEFGGVFLPLSLGACSTFSVAGGAIERSERPGTLVTPPATTADWRPLGIFCVLSI